jgi:hypothetical protein
MAHSQGQLLRLVFVVFVELKLTGFDRLEQVPGQGFISRRHKNFHGTQVADLESVDLSETFPSDHTVNSPGSQERADLLRLRLSVCNEHAAPLRVHHREGFFSAKKVEHFFVALEWRNDVRTRKFCTRPIEHATAQSEATVARAGACRFHLFQ